MMFEKYDEIILDCLLFNRDNSVTYDIHLLLVFVLNLCFFCKLPILISNHFANKCCYCCQDIVLFQWCC